MTLFFRVAVCTLLCFFCGSASLRASHIVGGEITYVCLGGTTYRITVDLYQDCDDGVPEAIDGDNPVYLAFYDADSNPTLLKTDSIALQFGGSTDVPPNFNNDCVLNPPRVCLKRARFVKEITLPASASGYYVVTQRCCRNASIVNIQNPGNTGASYFCRIPPSPSPFCNNSAVFRQYPPLIICANNPLVYDHGADDPDGDSLTYEFCDAEQGLNVAGSGASISNPKPNPPSLPPYRTVIYQSGYTPAVPLAGYPLVKISPSTGLITGTPNIVGRFVVAVCCNEYRNGILINTTKREFQFVVTNCSKAVVANIPQYSEEFNTYIVECSTRTVRFTNLSTGANTSGPASPYSWDFGVSGTDTDVSDEFEPTFTYPDTGTYRVKLVVNRGSTCPDSIERLVKVYPSFNTAFDFGGLLCPNAQLDFFDSSRSTYVPVDRWAWNFGDGTTSADQNPSHAFASGAMYNVTLVSGNRLGCLDTFSVPVDIEKVEPFAGQDTIIVVGERIQFRGRGGEIYSWSPPDFLSATDISNPVGIYPVTGITNYVMNIRTRNGCTASDSVRVWVVDKPSVFVPTAFSPNGDGRNDRLRPIAIGYRSFNYFRIFNRWGQQVFFTNRFDEGNYGDGWDGSTNGVPQDGNTYFWVLSLVDRFGQTQLVKGDATLVR